MWCAGHRCGGTENCLNLRSIVSVFFAVVNCNYQIFDSHVVEVFFSYDFFTRAFSCLLPVGVESSSLGRHAVKREMKGKSGKDWWKRTKYQSLNQLRCQIRPRYGYCCVDILKFYWPSVSLDFVLMKSDLDLYSSFCQPRENNKWHLPVFLWIRSQSAGTQPGEVGDKCEKI